MEVRSAREGLKYPGFPTILPYRGCLPPLARPSRSLCLWAIQMCVHAVYVPFFYDSCCLSGLISLSVWEPSAVCQLPCLTSMLISINYYGIWNGLVVWCCESHTFKSELDWKPFNALPLLPSLLVSSISSEPWWESSWAAQYLLYHPPSSGHWTGQLLLSWPPRYLISLDTELDLGWTRDSSRRLAERTCLPTGVAKMGDLSVVIFAGEWKGWTERGKDETPCPTGMEPLAPTSLPLNSRSFISFSPTTSIFTFLPVSMYMSWVFVTHNTEIPEYTVSLSI